MTLETLARPRRGAPRKTDATARERIMSVAEELFYREGIRATGVDRIVEVSGVSKTSLYRVFQSKDELIAAYAKAHDQRFWERWDKAAEIYRNKPLAQLNAVLDGVAESIGRPTYRGCPFINLAIELPDENHPARIIAAASKTRLKTQLENLVAQLSVANPGQVAEQILLLVNGAYANGSIDRHSVTAAGLKDAAAAIIAVGRKNAKNN
jgi:AcrR family transcriptional regulator